MLDRRHGRNDASSPPPSDFIWVEVATLALAGCATALATGLGAIPVWLLGARAEQLRPALWGLTVGLMGVASVVGLLLPALEEGSSASVAAGLATGVAFLLASRSALKRRDVHVGETTSARLRADCSWAPP